MPPRLPHLQTDRWRLLSAEALHAESPETFHIPPTEGRYGLCRGFIVKLLFHILGPDDPLDGGEVERMWVLISSGSDGDYLGVLCNQPATAQGHYLKEGAELPFLAEHICAIDVPPAEWAEERLAQPPTHAWPPKTPLS